MRRLCCSGGAERILALERAEVGNRVWSERASHRPEGLEPRDVGRGEQSVFALAGELVDRMTTTPTSLIFSQEGFELRHQQVEGLGLTCFQIEEAVAD